MTAKIEINGLVKRFGGFTAVDDVSFTVQQGEVLGFLGPNGAGKSTTMKMVTGFLTPTSGSVSICGHDMLADPIPAKRRIGYLPEGAPAYPDMTPVQLLDFVASVRGVDGATRRRRIAEVSDLVNLHAVLDQRIETLSKGFKRRVGLGVAILHDPEVLVMDEPTDGLDPNQKHEVRKLIRQMAADKAIILSTHILEEVEAVCSRATIIARGKIVMDGTPAELQARSPNAGAVTLRVANAPDGAAATLRGLADVARLDELGTEGAVTSWRLLPASGVALVGVVHECAREAGWSIVGLDVDTGRLDDVFRAATGGPTGDPGGATPAAPTSKPEPVETGAQS